MIGEKYNFYQTASSDRYTLLKEFAKQNRAYPTEAETCLWSILKGINLGTRFRRQYVIGDFIVDFVCLEKKLVLEVDGAYHAERQQMENDESRTEALNRMGFKVIRFTNEEVMYGTTSVVVQIKNEIDKQNVNK